MLAKVKDSLMAEQLEAKLEEVTKTRKKNKQIKGNQFFFESIFMMTTTE